MSEILSIASFVVVRLVKRKKKTNAISRINNEKINVNYYLKFHFIIELDE